MALAIRFWLTIVSIYHLVAFNTIFMGVGGKRGEVGTCPVWEGVVKQCFCPPRFVAKMFSRKRHVLKPNYIFCLSVLKAFRSFQEVCLRTFQSSPNVSPTSKTLSGHLLCHWSYIKLLLIQYRLLLLDGDSVCFTMYNNGAQPVICVAILLIWKKNLHDLITSLNGEIGPIQLV